MLRAIWKAAEQPCGKRLKSLLSTWLPHYEGEHGRLKAGLRKKVLTISASHIDNLLASEDVSAETERRLRATRASLNPFELHRRLEEGLRAILHRALHSSRPADSLHSAPDAGTTPPTPVS